MTYPPKNDIRHTEPFIKHAWRVVLQRAAWWIAGIVICCAGLYLVLHGR